MEASSESYAEPSSRMQDANKVLSFIFAFLYAFLSVYSNAQCCVHIWYALSRRCGRCRSGYVAIGDDEAPGKGRALWSSLFHPFFGLGCLARCAYFIIAALRHDLISGSSEGDLTLAAFLSSLPTAFFSSCFLLVLGCFAALYHPVDKSKANSNIRLFVLVSLGVIFAFVLSVFLFSVLDVQPLVNNVINSVGMILLYIAFACGYLVYSVLIHRRIQSQLQIASSVTFLPGKATPMIDVSRKAAKILRIGSLVCACLLLRAVIMIFDLVFMLVTTRPVTTQQPWIECLFYLLCEVLPLSLILYFLISNSRSSPSQRRSLPSHSPTPGIVNLVEE